MANQVAQLNCGASPDALPVRPSTALSVAQLQRARASAETLPTGLDQRLDCSSGTPLDARPAAPTSTCCRLLTTEAELANGTNALNVDLGLGITGVDVAPS